MRHQCIDLQASKHKKRKPIMKPRPPSHKNDTSDRQSHYKKSFDAKNVYRNRKRCQKCGDSNHIESFQCPAKKFQWKSCHKYGHFTSLCYQKKQASFKSRKPKAHMLQEVLFMLVVNQYAATQKIVPPVMSHSVCKWKSSNHKVKVRRFPHPLTWIPT